MKVINFLGFAVAWVGIVVGFLAVAEHAEARWADIDDASYVVNFEHRRVQVRKDGSSVVTIEKQIEIKKDSARESEGLMRFEYDSSMSQFKILEAKTLNPGETVDVPKQDREDRPLASRGSGFDVINQVTMAFPKVNVGSKLYFKIQETSTHALIPDYYFTLHALWGQAWQQLTIDFESERPIYTNIYDPDSKFKIEEHEKSLHLELKAPYYRAFVEENESFYSNDNYVWYSVSTARDWSEFPKSTLKAYSDDLDAKLPPGFQKIADAASKEKTNIDQLNSVTSQVAQTIRYVGDWRALEGIWHPRGLELVSSSGFGDCKDFSISAGAILKKLGFDVHVAWVMRRREWTAGPLDEKALDVNHAILFVEKDSKQYWIDPTNFSSTAQSIYADIADRVAYVLYNDHIEIKKTPPMKSTEGGMRTKLTIDVSHGVNAKGEFELLGRSAEAWSGNELRFDKKATNYGLINWIAERSKLLSWSFGDYDLKSRVTQDLKFNFTYEQIPTLAQTSAGAALPVLPLYFIDHFRIRKKDRVTDLLLANPQMLDAETIVKGRAVVLKKPMKCSGDSPWAAFSRTISLSGQAVKVVDHLEVKTLRITAAEIATPKFAEFQAKILNCMPAPFIVFK